jgi:Flp pilus assembly pilin Flp
MTAGCRSAFSQPRVVTPKKINVAAGLSSYGTVERNAESKMGSTVVSKVLKLLNKFREDERGAAMAEYVVLLGLIVGAMVFVITNFSGVLQSKFTSVCASLGGSC